MILLELNLKDLLVSATLIWNPKAGHSLPWPGSSPSSLLCIYSFLLSLYLCISSTGLQVLLGQGPYHFNLVYP